MKIRAIVLALAVTVFLAGCAVQPENGRVVSGNNGGDAVSIAIDDARTALAARDAGLRVVTAEDNGNRIVISAGEKLIVELLSNGTTGYSWQVVENDTALLSLTGHEYIIPDYPPGFCGGGGVERFEFSCREGSSRLKLVYRRPFAPSADDDEYSIVVDAMANK